MKSFWDQRQMTNLEFFPCSGRAQGLLRYKRFLISSIIHKDFTGKYGCKPYERTSLKARSAIFLAMMQIRASSHRIRKSIPSPSKKVIILPPKGKWSYNNFYTLSNSEWLLQINPLFALRLLQINAK